MDIKVGDVYKFKDICRLLGKPFSDATNKKVENENEYLFFVMPTLRFVYLYREKVQLYSALSLGLTYATDDGFNAWGDIALVGCSFGDKVFGFAELGLGLGGNARIGIGVRLESKKK